MNGGDMFACVDVYVYVCVNICLSPCLYLECLFVVVGGHIVGFDDFVFRSLLCNAQRVPFSVSQDRAVLYV